MNKNPVVNLNSAANPNLIANPYLDFSAILNKGLATKWDAVRDPDPVKNMNTDTITSPDPIWKLVQNLDPVLYPQPNS
jgi:hypothetical protein